MTQMQTDKLGKWLDVTIASPLVEAGYTSPKLIKAATDEDLGDVLSQEDLSTVRGIFPENQS